MCSHLGMALMAFLAQMFMSKGKLGLLQSFFDRTDSDADTETDISALNSYDFSSVAFMSGAALLLAKIALLFTALVTLSAFARWFCSSNTDFMLQ
jgi:hypothetical protein